MMQLIGNAILTAPARVEEAVERGSDRLDCTITNAFSSKPLRIAVRLFAFLLGGILLLCTIRLAGNGQHMPTMVAAVSGGVIIAISLLSLFLFQPEEE